MPVYTEDGYALTRTIEALALQRDDMHKAFRNLGHRDVPAGVRDPEIHVIAIFDGYDVVQVRLRPLARPLVCAPRATASRTESARPTHAHRYDSPLRLLVVCVCVCAALSLYLCVCRRMVNGSPS